MIMVTPAKIQPLADLYREHLSYAAQPADKIAFLKKHMDIGFIASAGGHESDLEELKALEFAYTHGL